MRIFDNIFKPKVLNIEIFNEINQDLNVLIDPLIEELNTVYARSKLKGTKIDLIIAEDFGTTVYKYAIDEEKEYYDVYGHPISNGNFSIVTENNMIIFKLIIHPRVFEDQLYLSTITHEFTHAVDFSEYIKRYGNPFIMSSYLKNSKYYREFYLWTEFNAKKVGLLRYQKELDKKDLKLSLSIDNFIHEIESETYKLPQLYHLMHFFARVYVCNNQGYKFEIDIYTENFLINKFGAKVFSIQTTIEKIKNFKDFEKEKYLIKHLIFPFD